MKVGITGTMSCGKTTLVKALSQLPEFSDFEIKTERSKYLRDLGIPLNTDSTILGQNIFLGERSLELMYPKLITDRTAIDVAAFTWCAQSISVTEKYNFMGNSLSLAKYYDYIFYVSPEGVEIEDNSVRTTDPDYRMKIDETIKSILKENIIKHYLLKGTTEQRIDDIKKIIFPQ